MVCREVALCALFGEYILCTPPVVDGKVALCELLVHIYRLYFTWGRRLELALCELLEYISSLFHML